MEIDWNSIEANSLLLIETILILLDFVLDEYYLSFKPIPNPNITVTNPKWIIKMAFCQVGTSFYFSI